MILLAFRRAPTRSLLSWLVAVVAGRPVHCAVVTETGHGYEAQSGIGVRPVTLALEEYECIALPFSAARALAFCEPRVGLRYDYLAAVLHWTTITATDRWTCSELCAEALAAAGAPLDVLKAGRTPRGLYRWATRAAGLA
jgi:hypothetical protein